MRLRLFLALVTLAACHKSLPSEAGGGPVDDAGVTDAGADVVIPPSFDPAPLASAICDAIRACDGCAWPECETTIVTTIPTTAVPGQVFDHAALDGCIVAYRKLVAGGCAPVPELPTITPHTMAGVCSHIFNGTLPPGAPCTASTDCAAGPNESAGCRQTCVVARATAGEGDRCGDDIEPGIDEMCRENDGIYCTNTSFGFLCQRPPTSSGLGQPCGSGCDAATYCDPSGVCAARQPVGAPCVVEQHVTGSTDNCTQDGHCAGGTCVANPKTGGVPQPCFSFPQSCAPLACP